MRLITHFVKILEGHCGKDIRITERIAAKREPPCRFPHPNRQAGAARPDNSRKSEVTPHQFELAVTASGAETRYPDLDCVGKLTGIGSSKSYVFFGAGIDRARAWVPGLPNQPPHGPHGPHSSCRERTGRWNRAASLVQRAIGRAEVQAGEELLGRAGQ
jgi:hypothetical protein